MIFDSTNSNTCCNLFRWNRLQQFLLCPDPCSIKAITHHEGKLWGPLCNRVSLHINISGSCYKDRNDICKDYVQLSQIVNGYISGYQWLQWGPVRQWLFERDKDVEPRMTSPSCLVHHHHFTASTSQRSLNETSFLAGWCGACSARRISHICSCDH